MGFVPNTFGLSVGFAGAVAVAVGSRVGEGGTEVVVFVGAAVGGGTVGDLSTSVDVSDGDVVEVGGATSVDVSGTG